jgi:hypothetical protein
MKIEVSFIAHIMGDVLMFEISGEGGANYTWLVFIFHCLFHYPMTFEGCTSILFFESCVAIMIIYYGL